jgi:hypothetical protein
VGEIVDVTTLSFRKETILLSKAFNMVRMTLLIFLLTVISFGCQSPEPSAEIEIPEIVPTQFEPIGPGENGVTVQQMSDHSQEQFERIKRNTLNHRIPAVEVLNSENETVDLSGMIEKPTFILAMDTDCSFGQMYARENFPLALNRPEIDRSQFDMIFLISTYRDQTFESDKVVAFKKEMEELYDNVCLISEKNAMKLNATEVTTLLTDSNGVVLHFRKGTALNPDQENQIFDYMLSMVDSERKNSNY